MPNGGGSSRTIDPGVTVFSAAEIRVAVLPMGTVPRDVLEEYLALMQRFRTMSLSAVRSFYQHRADKTPFQSIDWSAGAMHFRFMAVEDARRKSRVVELHPSRQIVAVLGIMHCPVAPSVAQAYEEFSKACREQFPEARVARCFVFEPSEDHIRQDGQQHIPGMVVFPPAGGQAHLEQHLEVWMHDLAALVLGELEQWVLDPTPRASSSSSARPSGASSFSSGPSYTDASEFVGTVTVMEEMAKRLTIPDDEVREKRRRGRLHKAQGDVCLMAGSTRDALNNYRVAQELSKATNDWVWCGAALEGSASARVIEVPRGTAGGGLASPSSSAATTPAGPHSGEVARTHGSSHGAGPSSSGWPSWDALRARGVEGEVRELLTEAKACYRKKGGVFAMQVENSAKLARLLAGMHGRAARREVSELASSMLELVGGLHFPEDRLIALAEAAQLYGLVGAVRRRALLLWAAVDLARAIDKGEVLKLAVKALEPPDDPAVQDPLLDPSSRVHWALRQAGLGLLGQGGPLGSHSRSSSGNPSASLQAHRNSSSGSGGSMHFGAVWPSVQVAMLESLLQVARQAGAAAEAWEATAAMLRHHYASVSPSTQTALLEGLALAAAALPLKLRSRPGLGPPCPLVHLRRPMSLSAQHQPHRMAGPLGSAGRQDAAAGAGTSGSGETGAGGGLARTSSASPFIFNPNAEKRRDQQQKERSRRRAAAAGAAGNGEPGAVPEWVCGEEARVEVELTNPLATAVKIEAVALHAHFTPSPLGPASPLYPAPPSAVAAGPHTPPDLLQQQQQVHTGAFWRPAAVHLVLPPHSKPVKLQLSGTPLLPGTLTLTGLRVSALGAQWFEPFGYHRQKPSAGLGSGLGVGCSGGLRALQYRLSAEGAAAGGLAPQWRQMAVTVLPQLPLLQAVLRRRGVSGGAAATSAAGDRRGGIANNGGVDGGGEVLAATPLAAEDLPSSSLACTSSSALSPAAGVPAGAGGAPPPALLTQRAPSLSSRRALPVWQGQRCTWELTLTNVGAAPATSLALAVLGGGGSGAGGGGAAPPPRGSAVGTASASGGAVVRPLAPQGHLRGGFVGVHLDTGSAAAAAALARATPLAPGASVVVPVEVHVGQPPGDAYEELSLEVRISYTGPSAPDASGQASPTGELLGRHLSLPLQFQVQRTVQVAGLQFLDLVMPTKDGARCWTRRAPQEMPSPNAGPTGTGRSGSYRLPSSPLGRGLQHQQQQGQGASGLGQELRSEPASRMQSAWSANLQDLKASARFDMHPPSLMRPSDSMSLLWQPPEEAEIDLGLGPTPAATPSTKAVSWDGTRPSFFPEPRPTALEAGAGPGTSAATTTTRVSLTTECAMDVSVVSACERYLRVWLVRLPPAAAAAHEGGGSGGTGRGAGGGAVPASSRPVAIAAAGAAASEPASPASVILPPGDSGVLRCEPPLESRLPVAGAEASGQGAAAAAATGRGAGTHVAPQPRGSAAAPLSLARLPDRMAAAEALCDTWAVSWCMIGSGDDGGSAPSGLVQLSVADVAASLTPQAVCSLQPSQLTFGLTAVYTNTAGAGGSLLSLGGGAGSPRPRVQDLTRRVQELDIRGSSGPAGEIWGIKLGLGEAVDVEVLVSNCSPAAQLVQFSLGALNMACMAEPTPAYGAATYRGGYGAEHAVAADVTSAASVGCGVDSGVLLLGLVERVRCSIQPGGSHVHPMSVMFVQPGLYQLYVYDVLAATATAAATLAGDQEEGKGAAQEETASAATLSGDWGTASRVYACEQRLNVLCM